MAKYVDGFVFRIPRKALKDYQKIARIAGRVWKEYGALEYRECVGDDLDISFGHPFPKLTRLKADEVVIFSWITYKSKAHRNSVNKKVMADPRIKNMGPEQMPFDARKMSYGGFKTLVDL